MNYWEIITDNLSKAGWSWGCVATIDSSGQTIFVADAHPDDGKRFIVSADEKLTALLELERITHNDNHRNQAVPLGAGKFLKRPASSLCS